MAEIIKVDGKSVDIDIKDSLTISDVSDDMDRVAALMGYWGGVWATAEAEKIDTDAYYRHWKAKMTTKIMMAEPKLAVQKIAAKIEADDKFLVLKKAQAKASQNVIVAKSHYESFRTKAHILQSKGAMYRAEFDATNMKTRETPNQNEQKTKPTEKEKLEAVREAMLKTKKRKQ